MHLLLAGIYNEKENLAGIKYRAAKLRGDIIHYSWVLDCCSQKKLLHLQPKLVMLFNT
jgi:DNA ligase-4